MQFHRRALWLYCKYYPANPEGDVPVLVILDYRTKYIWSEEALKGWMYILECADGKYYTGSTKNLELRLWQHQTGCGANHTRSRLPTKLVYVEEFERIDEAFYKEKQVQRWRGKKKEALIRGMTENIHKLAECLNKTHFKNYRKK